MANSVGFKFSATAPRAGSMRASSSNRRIEERMAASADAGES